MKKYLLFFIIAMLMATSLMAQDKPNILVIWGEDIGNTNISANTHGLMGYRTPNIDRIAHEGMRFTDYYGEQSCTAGRAAFLLGQSVFRSGLSKVGLPRRGNDYSSELRSAPRASRRVESSTGSGDVSSFTISGISVHPSTTASHPLFSPRSRITASK